MVSHPKWKGYLYLLQSRGPHVCQGNIGAIWHLATTVDWDHKSAGGRGNKRGEGWTADLPGFLRKICWVGDKEEKKEKRNGDKLLHGLATGCLECWSVPLWASGFSLGILLLLLGSLRLSQRGAHLIYHTGLCQLSLNTLESRTKIQMSPRSFTVSQMRGGSPHWDASRWEKTCAVLSSPTGRLVNSVSLCKPAWITRMEMCLCD